LKNRDPAPNNEVKFRLGLTAWGVDDMFAYLRKSGVLVALGGLLLAGPAWGAKAPPPANVPARLILEDNAKLFSSEAVDRAKKAISEHKGTVEREVHVETYAKLSEADQKRFDEVKADAGKKAEFWRDWARGKVAGEKGLVVLINWDPGHVHVVTSDVMGKAFTGEHRDEVQRRLVEKFKAAKAAGTDAERQKLQDEALVSAMEYAGNHIPASFGTTAPAKGGAAAADKGNGGGRGRAWVWAAGSAWRSASCSGSGW
jgi:hypothetical protein